MPVIFGGAPGRIVALQGAGAPATTSGLQVEAFEGFQSMRSIMTQVGVSRRENAQFMHTMGDGVYLYVFGDRVGQIVLGGLSFGSQCRDDPDELGIERVLRYYDEQRLAVRETPLRITLGTSTTLTGFLESIDGRQQDPELRIYQFTMNLVLVPGLA